MKIFTKDRAVLALAFLMVAAVITIQYVKAQASTNNPFSFYLPLASMSIGAGSTDDKQFCVAQTDSAINGSIPWPAGAANFFRVGANLALVNSVGAITVTRWQFATATGNDLTAADLTATFNAAGKIVLTNTSGNARDVTRNMTICVSANITAVNSSITSMVDNSNNLIGADRSHEELFTVY